MFVIRVWPANALMRKGVFRRAPVGWAKPRSAHARRRKSRAYANRDGPRAREPWGVWARLIAPAWAFPTVTATRTLSAPAWASPQLSAPAWASLRLSAQGWAP